MPEQLLSAELEAKFNRLKISEKDFAEACEYLDRFSQEAGVVVQRALIVAAIVAYARPFKKSFGSKAQAENSIDIPKSFFTDDEKALHNKVITLRDQGVAHSDFERKPTRRVEAQGRGFMNWSKPFDPLSELLNTLLLRDIAGRLENYCVDQMFAIDQQLRVGSSEGMAIRAAGIALTEGKQEISITLRTDDC